MADDKIRDNNDDLNQDDDDFGALTGGSDDSDDLGNLPPLSDFESSEGILESDTGLPPIGNTDSGGGADTVGGLPPISDIPVETPTPSGGGIRTPSGLETPSGFDTPTSDAGLETPTRASNEGAAFQDLVADSDFTPETPEIGPGPDSDIDTPLFDSAFGTPDSDFGTTPDTSAPTQAMETPIFGGQDAARGGGGFDADAFSDQGTPAPDFKPDTAAPVMQEQVVYKEKKSGGAVGVLVGVFMLLVGALVGLFVGPMASESIPIIPNASRDRVVELEGTQIQQQSKISDLTRQVQELLGRAEAGAEMPTPEQIEALMAQQAQLNQEIQDINVTLTNTRDEYEVVTRQLELKNEDYLRAQNEYEQLLNEASILEARRDGMTSEVARLEDMVGQLEDANLRRIATKDALAHSAGLLTTIVKESIPLTPPNSVDGGAAFDHDSRVAQAQRLEQQIADAKWVSPELLEDFTGLFNKELAISQSRQYFYAKVPVTDRFGTQTSQWAECLQNGNWSVYYRTLDGDHVGVYTNLAPSSSIPRYGFHEGLPPVVKKTIEETILDSRVPGYEEKLAMLAERELMLKDQTELQRVFDSL